MKRLALVCCLMLVLIPTIIAGCTSSGEKVPTNLRELSFTDMWNKVVNTTGVNEVSAHLSTFTMHTGKNNSIESMYFGFYGSDTSGRFKTYFVDVGSTGSLKTHQYDEDTISLLQQTISPGDFFDALDQADLSKRFNSNKTTYIVADSEAGSIGYSNEFGGLYLLENGRLTPLKEVIFYSNMPWLAISIFNMLERGNGTLVSDGMPDIWLLPQDLGKADEVEYLNQSFGIYLVNTGELVLSDEHIESYNTSTHEIALNEAGIEKWNSYIIGTPPTLAQSLFSKEFAVKVDSIEIYRGKFWSWVSSQSYDGIVILDALLTRDNENSKISIDNGYPASNSSNDRLNDPRIIDFFEREGLLK